MKDRAALAAFILSVSAHYLILSAAGINLRRAKPEKPEETAVILEIEIPPTVPDIDVVEDEKMIKEREAEPEEAAEEPETASELYPDESAEDFLREAAEEKKQDEKSREQTEITEFFREEMLRYQDIVKRGIEKQRRYPALAKNRGIEGAVYINFTVMADGKAEDIRIIRPSNFEILDREALATVRRAAPFPPFPESYRGNYLEMEVNIIFKYD